MTVQTVQIPLYLDTYILYQNVPCLNQMGDNVYLILSKNKTTWVANHLPIRAIAENTNETGVTK